MEKEGPAGLPGSGVWMEWTWDVGRTPVEMCPLVISGRGKTINGSGEEVCSFTD